MHGVCTAGWFTAAFLALQVVGWGLMPFTVDKQTLMLASLWRAFRNELVPFAALNISSWAPADAASPHQ